jgi:hypothetical protein
MEIDLEDVPPGDTITVKLESGRCFWEIDYIGMDFSKDDEVRQTTLGLREALDQRGNDISPRLRRTDKSYYVQPEFKDEGRLRFGAPAVSPSLRRTVFLHTRGYYLVGLDPEPRGEPDIARLLNMKKPGGFNRFSNRLYLLFRERMTAAREP